MSMNHESTVNHWPPIINNRSTPCYLTPVYSDVLLGSFSGVIFFATLLSAVWLHHQYILHHNINLLIIHFHSTNRNILRVHCVFRWNFTDLSSLIGLEQQNNTSSSQITCTNLHDYIHSIQVSNMIYKKNGFQTAAWSWWGFRSISTWWIVHCMPSSFCSSTRLAMTHQPYVNSWQQNWAKLPLQSHGTALQSHRNVDPRPDTHVVVKSDRPNIIANS